MKLLMRWAVLAFSMWVATLVIDGIKIDGGFKTYFWVAALFGLINAVIGLIVKVLTFPITIVTFGIFILFINAAMLSLTDRWSTKLEITNFWSAFFAALVITLVTTIFKNMEKTRSALWQR